MHRSGGYTVGKSLLVKTIVLWLFTASAFALALFGAEANAVRKAPELTFTVPGKGQELLSQFRGKVVALEFIKTTCPHCQAASQLMTKLQQEFGSRGFQAIEAAINAFDEGENQSQANLLVAAFTRDYNVGFPVGWTTRDQFLQFMGFSLMELTVVPQLVMIDRRGDIRYQTPARGDEISMREATIRQRLQELLAESTSASNRNPGKRTVAGKKGS